MWAILSGIEGNLAALEAVLRDIKSLPIEQLYILGDLVGINPDSEKVVQRILKPHGDELSPQVCRGWWEEQCLILHGLGATGEPTELLEQYGAETVKKLWDSVSHETVKWLAQLEFGFVELDCLLIHGSSVSVSEQLTPKTSPWQILDRLLRMEVNHLFCARSGEVFTYELQAASIATTVTTLDERHPPKTMTTAQKSLIGVGSVGRKPATATYTLYNPYTNGVELRTVCY